MRKNTLYAASEGIRQGIKAGAKIEDSVVKQMATQIADRIIAENYEKNPEMLDYLVAGAKAASR